MTDSVLNRVIECIAITTRYPKQLLTPTADLENDLGIDSVKRVEIVTALADEFQLDLLSQERDPSIRTIQQVGDWITKHLDSPPKTPLDNPGAQTNGPVNEEISHARANEIPLARPTAIQPPSNPTPRFSPPHSAPAPSLQRTTLSPAQPIDRSRIPQPLPQTQSKSLDGRVALITGSGRGVGRTIARVLAARGATVIVNSFHSRDMGDRTVAEIQETGGKAIHMWGSVANPKQVEGIFGEIERQFGFMDILICNASDGKLGSFTEITLEDWNRAFQTNVTGHYQCAMHASRLMQHRGGGSIITMSSIAAQSYVQGMGCQGVVKSAVETMTRNLACELAPLGIRANCVSGGPVYGDVMSQIPETRSSFNYWESIVPDGELCSPLDLAATIAFLVSDDARGVNGAVWTVDHGASTRAHSRPLPQAGGPNNTNRAYS